MDDDTLYDLVYCWLFRRYPCLLQDEEFVKSMHILVCHVVREVRRRQHEPSLN